MSWQLRKINLKSMLKSDYYNQTPKHSLIYWVIVPVILFWLTVNYIIGSLRHRPSWLENGQKTAGVPSTVLPYTRVFNALPKSDHGYVTLWFDDIWTSQYLNAYPVLARYNLKATLAVPASMIDKSGRMNLTQVQLLQDKGWEITNHSNVHDCGMHLWEPAKIKGDLSEAKVALWKDKLTSDIFVSPCGVTSPVLDAE